MEEDHGESLSRVENHNKMASADETVVASLNLKGLQALDKRASFIACTSKHAALYELDLDTLAWTKANIDGTLFVYER